MTEAQQHLAALRQAGWTLEQIAVYLAVGYSTVARWGRGDECHSGNLRRLRELRGRECQ